MSQALASLPLFYLNASAKPILNIIDLLLNCLAFEFFHSGDSEDSDPFKIGTYIP